jgi:hypothetical protein
MPLETTLPPWQMRHHWPYSDWPRAIVCALADEAGAASAGNGSGAGSDAVPRSLNASRRAGA